MLTSLPLSLQCIKLSQCMITRKGWDTMLLHAFSNFYLLLPVSLFKVFIIFNKSQLTKSTLNKSVETYACTGMYLISNDLSLWEAPNLGSDHSRKVSRSFFTFFFLITFVHFLYFLISLILNPLQCSIFFLYHAYSYNDGSLRSSCTPSGNTTVFNSK